jgi:hypothetical protein
MLQNLSLLLTDRGLKIHKKFTDLIMDLRIAKVNPNTGNLDKSAGGMDLCDALRLSTYNIKENVG